MADNKCKCDLCNTLNRLDKIKKKVGKKDAEFLDDLMGNHLDIEMDLDYHKAVVKGTWPGSGDILKKWYDRVRKTSSIVQPISDLCYEILQYVIGPIVGVDVCYADIFEADLSCYDQDDKDDRNKILDAISDRYNVNRETIDKYQDSPLSVIATIILAELES